jgi:cytochrome c peroxidase
MSVRCVVVLLPVLRLPETLLGLAGSLGLVGLLMFSFTPPDPATQPAMRIKSQYLLGLARLDSATAHLQQCLEANRPAPELQRAFRQARLAYKQTEWLTEYYFPLSAKQLNGPAVPEGELDDGIGRQIDPQGFQVLEESLFPYQPDQRTHAIARVAEIAATIATLRRVAALTELSDTQLFDAARLEIFRLITLGISGFDSPVAVHSLPEAIASLTALQQALHQFPLAETNPAPARRVDTAFGRAIDALQGASFEGFDRLSFIRRHANPLSRLLFEVQQALHVPLPTDQRFLSPNAPTLLEPGAFNAQYFARYGTPTPTPGRVALGRRLFSNTALSGDGSRSCATCHRPDRAFTDGLPTAAGLHGQRVARNTPTLYNVALQGFQRLDAQLFYLEEQIQAVIRNPAEMNGSLPKAIAALQQDTAYAAAFGRAYPDGLTPNNLTNALATYLRSLTSLNARPDRYLRGEDVPMSGLEKQGFNLFMGKAKCGTCHYFPLFSGTLPPAYVKTESEVVGTPATRAEQQADADSGRYVSTKLLIHHRAFKIPTVRHAAQTAPYMHNGVYETLEEVIEFYNRGGGNGLGFELPNQTLPDDKLRLTPTEKRALVAFMRALE